MRNSERIYNTLNNIIKTSSDMCFFNYPQYEIQDMETSVIDLAVDSSNVHIIEEDVEIPLSITFTNNLEYLNDEVKFNFNILSLDKQIQQFTINNLFNSSVMSYSGTTHNTTINTSELLGEGEYLLKLGYQYNACTQIAKAMGKRHVSNTYNPSLPYKHYDANNDKYFVVLYKAEEPRLDIGITSEEGESTETTKDRLRATSLITEEGVSIYSIDATTEGDILVTLNGLVLSKDDDFTLDNGQITFAEPLKGSDIVSYIYIGKGNTSGLKNEYLSIDDSIVSGPTGSQGSNYVYHNTDTGKYEIYAEHRIQNPDSLVVILKGMVLTNKVDYYVSTSDSRRIILHGELLVGDWLNIIYDSGENINRSVTEGYKDVNWFVSRAPNNTNGEFIIEFSHTKTFDDIVQYETVPYEIGQTNYTQRVTLNYDYGTVLYYRVKNFKRYDTLNGTTLNSENISDAIKIEIKTNISNNY
jgi:hypothetical protein